MRWAETICLESLNPKVQGSIPCASTIMLCPTASGRVSGVPDVSTVVGQLSANLPLTAYLTAYGLRKRHLDLLDRGPVSTQLGSR
jgi:hypothetical protein